MSIDAPSNTTYLDASEVRHEHRNPLIGLVGSMAVFAGFGAAYVAFTSHGVGVVAQMGVVAAVYGAIAVTMVRAEH